MKYRLWHRDPNNLLLRAHEGTPESSEHEDVVWLLPSELQSLDWAPADIPAVEVIELKFDSL